MREADVLEELARLDDAPWQHKEHVLAQLHEILKYGNCELPLLHFKSIMRVCINAVTTGEENVSADKENADGDSAQAGSSSGWGTAHERSVAEAVKVLIWLCRRTQTRSQWLGYFDLILLRLTNVYGLANKEVTRAIEAGLPHIAHAVPAAQLYALLKPVIRTRDFPQALCAMKLAAEMAKARPDELTDDMVGQLMEGISQVADHANSAMRKAAIFAMVSFTQALGDDRMKPHLQHLSVSKMRLLQVYLRKTEEEQRSKGSPARNT